MNKYQPCINHDSTMYINHISTIIGQPMSQQPSLHPSAAWAWAPHCSRQLQVVHMGPEGNSEGMQRSALHQPVPGMSSADDS